MKSRHYQQAHLNDVGVTVLSDSRDGVGTDQEARTVSLVTEVLPGVHTARLAGVFVDGTPFYSLTADEARALVVDHQRRTIPDVDGTSAEILNGVYNELVLGDLDGLSPATHEAYRRVIEGHA